MDHSVCAVVVTYNRKQLLEECIRAILSQDYPVASLLVVDNASTDGTAQFAERDEFRKDPRIHWRRMPENRGGAGGFHEGIKAALTTNCQWLWLMDDDTVPQPSALAALLNAFERFPANMKPRILASRVIWSDATLHPMNFPTIKRATLDPETAVMVAEQSCLWIRWASFVSVLIDRSAVIEHGLPEAAYFMWNDDTEYTARILRSSYGVLVPASTVVHKTAAKHSPMDADPRRSYYQVRNVFWMVLRSCAWSPAERAKIAIYHLTWIARYLARQRFSARALRYVCAGVRDAFFKTPQQERAD